MYIEYLRYFKNLVIAIYISFKLFFIFSIYHFIFFFFFFFQAEDGIRDVAVTGVQTCALPISRSSYLSKVPTWAIPIAWTAVRRSTASTHPAPGSRAPLCASSKQSLTFLDRKSVV